MIRSYAEHAKFQDEKVHHGFLWFFKIKWLSQCYIFLVTDYTFNVVPVTED